MKRFFLLFFCFLFVEIGYATVVTIDGMKYDIKGIKAAVISRYGYDGDYLNYNFNYTGSSYIVPDQISYNGNTYVVDKVAYNAFRGYYADYRDSKQITNIVLPNTINTIGYGAFEGTGISKMIIPASVILFENSDRNNAFRGCDLLTTLIYLPTVAPQNWTATSCTYVPDKISYSSPQSSINDAHIIEMISFNENEFYYTGQAPNPTWTNNVEGYTASLTMPALKADVGNHEELIPVTFTKGDESFTANVVYRYTIKPLKLTAKVANASREYGEENPQFTISYSGFLSGDNESAFTTKPTVSTMAAKTSNVGEYPITISGGSAANYEFEYEPGVLTVTKAPISANVKDTTKVYGTPNPAFTIEYYGLKNDETIPAWTTRPTFQTEATESSSVGQYKVEAINGVPVNYDLGTITSGTLHVTPASLTIKANDAVRKYYSEEPNFSYKCTGFVNGDNESVLSPAPTLSTPATLTSNVGTYEIKVSEASSPNYSISYLNGTLTITPRTLVASVGNYERAYNEENPSFEIKYDGFAGTDTDSVLSAKPTASTTATKTSDVGTYPITVTGGSAENYQLSYTAGTLTVNKAEQTITWEQELTGLSISDQIELKAVASSGLPVTYSMDNTAAAEIYTAGIKTYLDCKAEGQFYIRATQEGNKNYYSSPRASKLVSIGTAAPVHSIMESSLQIQSMPFGIRVTNVVAGDFIQILSMDGALQKSVKAEKTTVDIPLSKGSIYIVKVGNKIVKIGF